MRVVIIGNGIIALSTAFRLLKKGDNELRITLIGPTQRPGSASLAAGAMLNSFAEIEYDTFKSDIDHYRFELNRKATHLWPKFQQDLAEESIKLTESSEKTVVDAYLENVVKNGTYVINNASCDELDDDNFDAILGALQKFNANHHMVKPCEIPSYNPHPKDRAHRALFIENEGWVNPMLVLNQLDAVLRQSGKFYHINDTVHRIEQSGNTINAAHTNKHGRIEGDHFLLANGASIGQLLENSGNPIRTQRVFYGVGVSLHLGTREIRQTNCIRTPARGLACGLYSVPLYDADDQSKITVGASNFISKDPYSFGRITSVETLMRSAIRQINHLYYKADLISVNVGWRPTSQDTYPMIGPTSISNLTVATGTKRDGFHMAPVLSDYIAKIVLGMPVDDRFSVFHPERPLIKTMSREQAVQKAVRHQISAAYQHGFEPATSRTIDQLRSSIESDVQNIHDKAGAEDWGIPPELLDMYRWGHARDWQP